MIELTIILHRSGDKLICIIISFFMYFDHSIDWVNVVRDAKEKSWFEKINLVRYGKSCEITEDIDE